MKMSANGWVVAVVALSFGGCKNKEKVSVPEVRPVAVEVPVQPGVPVTSSPAAPPPVPTPPVPSAQVSKVVVMSPDERAAKLGFVQHLPQDTEVVMAFHQGVKSVNRLQSGKLWKLVAAQMGMEAVASPAMDEEEGVPVQKGEADGEARDFVVPTTPEAAEPGSVASLFGTEFTIALGKSVGEQSANLLTGYRRKGYFQMRMLAEAFAAAAKAGDMTVLEQAMLEQYGEALVKDLLTDPESGIALIERLQMPPLYLAFRTSDAQRAAAAQQLASVGANLSMLGEMVEPVEVEKAGQKFQGQKISGKKIAASLAGTRAEMEKMLEPAAVDKLLAAIAKKDLVVVSGILGEYAVLFIGASTDDLVFATNPGQSLVASEAMAFCDAYASKDLAAVIYGQKGATDRMIAASSGLSDLAAGLRDGLAGSEGLGDTRDLEALLRMVGERETALRKLAGNDALGVTAFFEDGLKIESYGGSDTGAVDWKSPNKLAALGEAADVVMFADMTSEAAYDEKFRAYLEVLVETSFAMAMKVAEIKVADEQLVKFQQAAKLFDTKFRPDAVALWDALSGDFSGSLGQERACVIDLNGSVPALPGIPQAVVDQGKFPRISIVAPVTDRAKLAASWQKMNVSATNMLAKISELTGKDMPMQKPISSDKGGYTTWFFPLPFFNDDFMPSVTVGDQWFAASTSKNQALDLINMAAKGGPTRTGLCFTLNFKALQKFSRETLRVLDKHADTIFGGDGLAAGNMEKAGEFIAALDDMDQLTVHARREGGVLRSSIHFKTR